MTEETALYRYFDADSKLLYVGISLHPIARQSQHRGRAEWYGDFAWMTVQWFASREKAMEAEIAAIEDEAPMYNRQYADEDVPRPTKDPAKIRAGRLGAYALHARGGTTTEAARAAFLTRFEAEVDPDGTLPPDERARRAMFAKKAYYIRLAAMSAAVRRRRMARKAGGAA